METIEKVKKSALGWPVYYRSEEFNAAKIVDVELSVREFDNDTGNYGPVFSVKMSELAVEDQYSSERLLTITKQRFLAKFGVDLNKRHYLSKVDLHLDGDNLAPVELLLTQYVGTGFNVGDYITHKDGKFTPLSAELLQHYKKAEMPVIFTAPIIDIEENFESYVLTLDAPNVDPIVVTQQWMRYQGKRRPNIGDLAVVNGEQVTDFVAKLL